MASLWIGRDFGRIAQISRALIRHFLRATIQTLIAAKGGSNLTNFHYLQGRVYM